LFLLEYYKRHKDQACLRMAERTLTQMYRGGIFDHIGGGFSRYSTDRYWLAPHFEKMLYDNALLLMAYAETYAVTGKVFYKDAAARIADYVLRELTDGEGGFYCAQDADSGGEEGGYYVFTPTEITDALGEEAGRRFCTRYDITEAGNFEGKSIPNLLKSPWPTPDFDEAELRKLREYRAARATLHRDDKILFAWNGLMLAALADAYRYFGDGRYLEAADKAVAFIEKHRSGGLRFLDDYAFCTMAMIRLYQATFDEEYLSRAAELCEGAFAEFWDEENGGFTLTGKSGERLLFAPKETFDGAMPSGNSVMAWNTQLLALLTDDERWGRLAEEQVKFMTDYALNAPEGHCFFMSALLLKLNPPRKITCVLSKPEALAETIGLLPRDAVARVLRRPTKAYPLKDGKTTFYICDGERCLAPVNEL